LLGSLAGIIAGFYAGWVDTIVSRVTDVFFAIPLFLGAILFLFAFPSSEGESALTATTKVAIALALFGWTVAARIMRSSVIQVKQADFVQAARALGASNFAIIRRHVLANALSPVIVVATISLGVYIGAEAALSYLGIGLQPPVVSWGIAISDAQTYLRVSPHMMMFPIVFLSVTVLAFIMLGDAVREALDPKLR
jgi:oligopeptide transport system permease protein